MTTDNSYVEMEGSGVIIGTTSRPNATVTTPLEQQPQKPSYDGINIDHDAGAPPQKPTKESSTKGGKSNHHHQHHHHHHQQLSSFYRMAIPYFQAQPRARWQLLVILLLTLLNSGVTVVFSFLARDFWSALSDNDPDQFYGIMKQFVMAMLVLAPINVVYRYQRQSLAIRWREWMTNQSLALYFSHKVYYGLEQQQHQQQQQGSDSTTTNTTSTTNIDNPDQRIAEDVRSFTEFSLTLLLTILMATVDLICFSAILFQIMPALFLAILLFATVGTVGTMVIGRTLVHLNFEKLQTEANFRFALVRVREHAESIAFLRGEPVEQAHVHSRLQSVLDNMHALNAAVRNLDFFTTYYTYLTWILPILVVAPDYFAGNVALGVVQQAAASFGHVLSDMSLLVTQWESLTEFSAGMERLATFFRVAQGLASSDGGGGADGEQSLLLGGMASSKTAAQEPAHYFIAMDEESGKPQSTASKIQLQQVQGSQQQQQEHSLVIHNLTLTTPNNDSNSNSSSSHSRILIQNLSLSVPWDRNLLIVGSSGQGKSSLLRAIAGLWTNGSGRITRPHDSAVYFLPQKPYCATGTLRDQLLYPSTSQYLDPRRLLDEGTIVPAATDQTTTTRPDPTSTITDDQLLDILRTLELSELPLRAGQGNPIRGLDAVMDWTHMLSLGEQQRLAFGRILVHRPSYVILDESTSALDIASERRMYGLLQSITPPTDCATTTTTTTGQDSQPAQRRLSYVSVGHRPSLLDYHDTKLNLVDGNTYSVEPIDHSKS